MDYNQLDHNNSPEPPPFQQLEEEFKNNSENEGIYLQWILPKGFTHATATEGVVKFPLVPNRWLIIRKKHNVSTSTYDAAWVVISDKLDSRGGSPFRIWKPEKGFVNKIGAKVHFDTWNEDNLQQFLTADGAGDITFSSFQSSGQNVFSIHDELAGIDRDTEVELDYSVFGWFSDPISDPLHGVNSTEEWIRVSERLLLDPQSSDSFPRSTVLTGYLQKVKWKVGSDPSFQPRRDHPNSNVVIGLTSTDAVCELLGHYDSTPDQMVSQLMEVFQYEQLHAYAEFGGEEAIDDAIHRSSFESHLGGKVWKLVKGEQAQDEYIEEDESILSDLADLNRLQKRWDQLVRVIRIKQQQLYEAWWKFCKCRHEECEEKIYQVRILASWVEGLIQEREEKCNKTKYLIQYLNWELRRRGNKIQLVCEEMPSFWSPNDLVVLITGFHKQTTGSLIPTTPYSIYEYKNEFGRVSRDSLDRLPLHVAEAVKQSVGDQINPVWTQPWMPLFLEWEVEWTSIPYKKESWELEGREIQLKANAIKEKPQKYMGRTLLGPHSVFSIKDRLNKYIEDRPDSINPAIQMMEKFVANMDDWDVLSQKLGGLNWQLLQRDNKLHPLPSEWGECGEWGLLNPLLENQTWLMPKHSSILDTSRQSDFQPFRCGHLIVKRLSVVDVFGQVEEVPVRQEDTFISESLRTLNEDAGVAELKPRTTQGARLNFHWVSASRDQMELNTSPSVNPVCALIIPNHLERGLSCYNPQGMLLGDVKLKGTGTTTEAYWEPAPDVSNSFELIQNGHLNKFVDSLSYAGNMGEELSSLLPVIDETLWVTNPKNRSFDQHLSVLIGRPLVLVRARLSLEINGNPLHHPKDFPDHNPSYMQKKFKIKLGNVFDQDDGLIGFYLNDRYNTFYSIYKPDNAVSPYIEEIQPSNYIQCTLSNEPVYVTMLFDPEGYVKAYTDIVPSKEITLLPELYSKAFQQMEVFFRTGPILTAVLDRSPDPNQIVMPTPYLAQGEWTWYERSRDDHSKWISLLPKDKGLKDLPTREAPTLREGLLKLSMKQQKS
ncbi:hypothetical protein [Paenibacillus polymyxa]|uniref:hypothetical protein n=1 Tax=Paenibacillus polymyxa TaxID=1406 RepID=UPI003218039F